MPCSTNNDPDDLFYDLTDSFKRETKILKSTLNDDQFLNHLVMFTSVGQIEEGIYVGYENGSDHVRDEEEGGGVDVCNVDGLVITRLVLSNVKTAPTTQGETMKYYEECDVSAIQFEMGEEIDDGDLKFEFEDDIITKEEEVIVESGKTLIQSFNCDLLVQIFQFVDTKSLLATCSYVCENWFRIIFSNKLSEEMSYLFMERTLNFFKKKGAALESIQSLKKLDERYQMNWLETYMMSGMFNFEMIGEVIEEELDDLFADSLWRFDEGKQTFFYTSVVLDPLQYLRDLPKNHMLIEKLSRHAHKVVSVSKNCLYSSIDQHFRLNKRLVTNLISLTDADNSLTTMQLILLTPSVTPLAKDQLSVDLTKIIPFYMDFLRNSSEKLEPLLNKIARLSEKERNEKIEWVGNCLCEMKFKAKYFLFEILPKHWWKKFIVGADILIGLHIYLLDDLYNSTNELCKLEPLNFVKLLENIQSYQLHGSSVSLEHVKSYLPESYQPDLMELLVNGFSKQYNDFHFETHLPFPQPFHAIDFLKEHIIDMGEIMDDDESISEKEWAEKYVEEYRTFIATHHSTRIEPTKKMDLFFHLHMLHPNNFIQDCKRLAHSIKGHYLNFMWDVSKPPWQKTLKDD